MLERSSVPRTPLSLPGARVLVIESPYYQDVAAALLEGAIAEIEAAGATYEKVSVPGALEIPQALGVFMDSDASIEFDGAVALGCVIRGETSHYDIVCNNANHWLYTVANEFGMPIGNAILTVDTHEQAHGAGLWRTRRQGRRCRLRVSQPDCAAPQTPVGRLVPCRCGPRTRRHLRRARS